jgi:type IV pilus assembly protein PilC
MAVFAYEGVQSDGKKVKGQLNAKSEAEVRVILRRKKIRPIRVKKPGLLEVDLNSIFSKGGGAGRIKENDLAVITRQFSTMLDSGVPIIQSLDILIAQTKDESIKKVLSVVRDDVSGGAMLWESVAKHKGSFDTLFVQMVKAGEAGGILDVVLRNLSVYLEKSVRLRRMVKGAMLYPGGITLVGIAVVVGMLYFVIPQFESMLKGAGQELPGPTQFLVDASDWLQNNILYVIVGSIAGFIAFKKWKATPKGREIWHRFVMKTPVFGNLAIKSSVARFSRTFGTLLGAGVSLVESLEICQQILNNAVFEKTITRVKKAVESGKSVSEPLAKSKAFPDMAIHMINVGENTGEMDKMLAKIAEYYEEEVETIVGSLSKILEPIILVVLGGMVAGILIAMYLPIFEMAGSV